MHITYDYAATVNMGVICTYNQHPAPVNFIFEQIQQLALILLILVNMGIKTFAANQV